MDEINYENHWANKIGEKIVIKQFFIDSSTTANSYAVILCLTIVSEAWEKCTARDNWMNKYLILSAIENCLFVFDCRRKKENEWANERACGAFDENSNSNGITIIGISFGFIFFFYSSLILFSLMTDCMPQTTYTWKIIKKY